MDKAKTLPRSKRDKSPSPSSSSFSSLKNATVLKISSFRALKGVPLMKGKKKKKDGPETQPLNGNTLNETPELDQQIDEPEAASTPIPQEVTPQEKKSSKKVKTPKKSKANKEPEPINPPVQDPTTPTAALDAVVPAQEKLKNPKKPKPPIKKIVKSGRGILTKFKGKNESAPIMVDTSLDARRAANKKPEDDELDPGMEEELKNGDIGEVAVTSKDEWSTTATCEKVRKLSRLEIQQSVYNEEVDGDGLPSPTTPEDEIFVEDETKLSASELSITSNGDTTINFDKKSPSTIKKEILSSINSSKIRKTSEPISNGSKSALARKISMQARNPSDKNELLFKILVIGELGTGKTSIIKRYVHKFFSQHYRATIGVDFALKVLQWDNETMIRLQLWDIAGQERFGNMTRVYYKEAVGAFIVFDVTRVGTFEAVTKWKQDLDAKVQLPDGESIPCVLLANKCDQPKEGIVNNSHKMDEFCKENQFVSWFETSAKDDINIDEAANCLVAKIIQNDQIRQQEKETTNGTGVININVENSTAESAKNKFCSAC